MGFHASDTDKPAWSDKDMLLGRIKELETEIENERAAHFTCVEMRNDAEAERDRLKSAFRQISMHYANQDMNHVDFRVFAKQIANDALGGQLTQDGKP